MSAFRSPKEVSKKKKMARMKMKVGIMSLAGLVSVVAGFTCAFLWPPYFEDILKGVKYLYV